MKKIKVIGQMEGTFESTNRVYDTDGISPSINTCGGGQRQPYILCRVVGGLGEMKSNNGTQYYQQDRVYSDGDVAPCIPANLPGGSYKFLFAVRGREEGQEPEVREGGVSNTITTVQKDNLICEVVNETDNG